MSVFFNLLSAEAFSVEEKFKLLAVCVDCYGNFLSFKTAKIPMRNDVYFRRFCPMGFVLIDRAFLLQELVKCT